MRFGALGGKWMLNSSGKAPLARAGGDRDRAENDQRKSGQRTLDTGDFRRRSMSNRPSATSPPNEPPALLQPLPRPASPTPFVKRTIWNPLSWLTNQISFRSERTRTCVAVPSVVRSAVADHRFDPGSSFFRCAGGL